MNFFVINFLSTTIAQIRVESSTLREKMHANYPLAKLIFSMGIKFLRSILKYIDQIVTF